MAEEKKTKRYTLEELSECTGENGKPILVAYKGRVVDVTESKLWKKGTHMARHHAGRDLTEEFSAAPHGVEVFDRYPQAGTLATEEKEEREMPAFLASLLKRYPMLRRHPHPMVVHFPIVFTFSAVAFTVLFLITGMRSFEYTAFNCLGGAILFTPVAMATGLYTWWLNYMAQIMKPVIRKLILSPMLLALDIFLFVWRFKNPDVLLQMNSAGVVYVILVLLLIPLITLIGWYGATMTFPLHEE